MERALRTLTLLQHGLFLALTAVCLVRSLTAGAPPLPTVALTIALLAWYAAGARASRRHPAEDITGAGPGRRGMLWFLGLTTIWLALVAVTPENVWLAFSLWLLAGHFLPARLGLMYAAATLAVVVLAPWWVTGTLTVAGVVGPVIGAAFAFAVSRGQVALAREGIERAALVRSLVAAQAETNALHTELAAAQRESGVLAERTRLSRDIHDTLAQGFSSVVLLARAGEQAPDADTVRALLRQIERTASANLDEARRVVGALAPRDLDGSGLGAALRRILDAFGEESGIHTELRVDGDLAALPTGVEVALLRTAQGALANVRRHAHATRVVLSLSELDDSVRLDIVDDGVGFEPTQQARQAAPTSAGGYGLPSTSARLRELGGDLDVESAPGEGTALSAHLPLGVVAAQRREGADR